MSGGSVLVERPRLRTNFFGTKNDMSRSRQSLSPSPSTPTLRRGISFTQFAKIKESTLEYLPSVQSKGTFTEGDLVGRGKSSADRTSTSSGTISPDNDPPTPPEPVSISAEHSDRGFPAFLEDVKAHEMFNTSTENFQLIRPEAMEPTLPPSAKGKLRRRSWMAPVSRSLSRPTSPKRTKPATETISENEPAALGSSEVSGEAEDMKAKKGRRNSWMTSNTTSEESEESDKANMLPRLETQGSPKRSRRPMSEMFGLSPAAATSEKPSLLSLPALNTDIPVKQSRRPLSGIFSSSPTTPKRSQEEPRSAPPVSIAKSFSLDRMPSLKDSLPSFDRLSNLSRVTLDDRTSFSKRDLSRGRDELWTAYKSLDVDFSKFQGKSSSVKGTIIRASLLPFLKAHSENTSIQNVRAEDLEKRTNVLNKWWMGLLEMLKSQNISGNDRPGVLDGIIGIMERPEWRAPPSDFAPIAGRSSNRSTSSHKRTHSSSSTNSSSSDFLTESIHHNIRNMFAQNILKQMGFVVEKMSLKNTGASIVAFCGKTCAYAFFFCPGLARFLISLWKLAMDPMRRILDEYGVPRHSVFGDVSKRISSAFPSHLHELKLVSLTSTLRSLQHNPTPPLSTKDYNWSGPWVSRWAGRDSDLFYVFFKNYHMLVADFLPTKAKKLERICAPGLLMVHAQLLTTLDATIHRNATTVPTLTSTTTFDDLLNDADATAPALPVAPANAHRLMTENRVITLLRDCLSENSFSSDEARHFSAQCLSNIVQAAARKTSLFDHNACYTLCDFLEEAIAIFIRYDNGCSKDDAVFDWSFWFMVWRKMVESQNTTTEIRLYSLLYNIWPLISEDSDRKVDFCINLLFDPDIFFTRFSHWCPMVRAYYMRLLSWRVARWDGSAPSSDTTILAKLMERLSVVWSHFLYTKQLPGTNVVVDYTATPNPPAPGRRLLIIRTDPSIDPSTGALLSFDDSGQHSVSSSRSRRNSWMEKAAESWRPDSPESSDSGDADDTTTRRWSLLRNVMGVTGTSRAKSQSPRPSARDGTDGGRSSPPVRTDRNDQPASSAENFVRRHSRQRSGSMPAAPRHRTFCFKFSLEYVDRRFQNPASVELRPPHLPFPAQQHLLSQYNLTAMFDDIRPTRPDGAAASYVTYTGRALAEWSGVVNECQNFFERRMREGVPSNKLVETPILGVETFKRPG